MTEAKTNDGPGWSHSGPRTGLQPSVGRKPRARFKPEENRHQNRHQIVANVAKKNGHEIDPWRRFSRNKSFCLRHFCNFGVSGKRKENIIRVYKAKIWRRYANRNANVKQNVGC